MKSGQFRHSGGWQVSREVQTVKMDDVNGVARERGLDASKVSTLRILTYLICDLVRSSCGFDELAATREPFAAITIERSPDLTNPRSSRNRICSAPPPESGPTGRRG